MTLSALSAEQKETFTGLHYFPYNPDFRFLVPVDTGVEQRITESELPDEGLFCLQRFGQIHLEVEGQTVSLENRLPVPIRTGELRYS